MSPRSVPLFLLLAIASCCKLKDPVDLGRSFNNNTIFFMDPFQAGPPNETILFSGVGYASNEFCSGEHTGTHMDAPYHFNLDGGWTITDIPVSRYFANGVLINVSQEVNNNREFLLRPSHIEEWIHQHGPLPKKCVVLVDFGWAAKVPNRTEYLGGDAFPNYSFPGISKEVAEMFIKSGKVIGVGVDTASIDAGQSVDFPAHVLLAKENIYKMENLDLTVSCLPARGFHLYIMPMKITNGTGAPVRILATSGDPFSDDISQP